MKKLFFILPLMLLFAASCERRQQVLHEGSSVLDDSTVVQWKEFLDHDTFVREVRSQGKIILIAKAMNEKEFRDSTFTETSYFPNGKPLALRSFSHGKQSGNWKSWYENGTLKSSSLVTNGVLRDYVSYYDDGSIAVTGSRLPDGTMSRTERWRNGNLKEEFTTDSTGKGNCVNYHMNGRKSAEGKLFNFTPDSVWHRWDTLGVSLPDTSYGIPVLH